MTKIAELFGLKPDASEDQILKKINAHLTEHTTVTTARDDFALKFKEASEELKKLRAIPKQNTPTVNPEQLALKTAAGLSRDQAISVLADQAEHDKTKPHDDPPKGAK
jgi:hypothetical protein